MAKMTITIEDMGGDLVYYKLEADPPLTPEQIEPDKMTHAMAIAGNIMMDLLEKYGRPVDIPSKG